MATFLNPHGRKTSLGEMSPVSVDAGWPDAHLVARPNDAIGAAILAYHDKWQHHRNFPTNPWDERQGDIYLPDLDGEPRPETDPVPRYRLREDAFLGCNLFMTGQEVSFAGWPVRPHTLVAINASAERVLSYQSRYGAGRTLPGMPHTAGKLNLPNPATTFGNPQNYMVRGSIGDVRPV
jgi:hypothetical protein